MKPTYKLIVNVNVQKIDNFSSIHGDFVYGNVNGYHHEAQVMFDAASDTDISDFISKKLNDIGFTGKFIVTVFARDIVSVD